MPGVASAQALTQLSWLVCWVGKQTNITSTALDELTPDVDSIRHAVLQNRAAIDFFIASTREWLQQFWRDVLHEPLWSLWINSQKTFTT